MLKKEKVNEEVKPVLTPTYLEVEELSNALSRLKNENIVGANVQAKMVNIRNRMIVKPYIGAIADVRQEPETYDEYRKKIYSAQEKHAQKAEDTSIQYFRMIDNVETKVFDKNEANYAKWIDAVAYGKEYKAINDEYKGVIDLQAENPKLVKEFMKSTISNFPVLESISKAVTNEAQLKTLLEKIPEDILDVLVYFNVVTLKTE